MDADLCCGILRDELQQTLKFYKLKAEDAIFQQDNDPKHTSKKAKKCLGDLGMTPMIWPAQSPDLNPIEHLWNYLKARLAEYEEPAHSVAELWEQVQEEWDKIPVEVCQNLIESMPRRLAAVVKAKGGYTKY